MLYPYWSSLKAVSAPAWLRAGQLCLCSENPDQAKSRVGIDCWLGDRWATQKNWALALQIPALDDPAWRLLPEGALPIARRPVVLALQNSRYGGFRLGCHTPAHEGLPDGWLMYEAGQWLTVPTASVLGWLTIPQRLSRRVRQPLQASRELLLTQVR
ncbi:MAG: hypothetical protein AAFZ80_01480 [Cyanobacteria bacterium P01_A01_bin.105]